ncbi:MAG: dynamin family protein [Deltaproteobacteria bacterium]|nr:dynamin family protein [Deltaproteobacteria bacterium]
MTSTLNSLETRLAAIERLAGEYAIGSLAARIESVRDHVAGDGIVDVVVVGQYKAGKSSLLNAVLGRDLLPVDVLPATSVVTRVMPGSSDEVIVRYLDGTARSYPTDRLAEFVTEAANPDNTKGVERADLVVRDSTAPAGFRFVDTPGLGSVFSHNSERAREWLPRIGAALVAIRVDQPIGEADLDLIRDLGAHTPDVAILLTKTDLATKSQIDHVQTFTRKTLRSRLGVEYPLIPVSVKKGSAASLEAIRRHLMGSDASVSADRSARIARHKLGQLGHQCRVYLERELAAANAGEVAAGRIRDLAARQRRMLAKTREELRREMEHHKSIVMESCVEHFRAQRDATTVRVEEEFDREFARWDGNLAELTARYAEWMEKVLNARLAARMEEGERTAREAADAARESVGRVLRLVTGELADAVGRTLGRRFETEIPEIPLHAMARPDVRVPRAFEIPVDLLWRIIPMKRLRSRVERSMRTNIAWNVEKNLLRFGAQWGERACDAIDAAQTAALVAIESELSSVERLAAASPDRADAIRTALATLDEVFLDSSE